MSTLKLGTVYPGMFAGSMGEAKITRIRIRACGKGKVDYLLRRSKWCPWFAATRLSDSAEGFLEKMKWAETLARDIEEEKRQWRETDSVEVRYR